MSKRNQTLDPKAKLIVRKEFKINGRVHSVGAVFSDDTVDYRKRSQFWRANLLATEAEFEALREGSASLKSQEESEEKPKKTTKKKRKRARDEDGQFQADDLSTPDVNEAYEPEE